MCTVTFIKKGLSDFIITSNRDELKSRATLPPATYVENGVQLVYPKDEVAGGTWIGASSQGTIICLLNGGFTAHERKDNYRMSRGIIVKKMLVSEDVIAEAESIDLTDIEPFTMILVSWKVTFKLYELVWDGEIKHLKQISDEDPHIWSSSSLYTLTMKEHRKEWFADFILQKNIEKQEILHFHHQAGIGNTDMDLQIDRGMLKTVSITQITKSKDNLDFYYKNLQTGEISTLKGPI